MVRARKTVEERFWANVDKRGPDECWPWLGTLSHNGYGTILIDGKVRRATRTSWVIAHGQDWPEGKDCCHTCDSPTCVNPSHLWPGTRADNVRDMLAKGRGGGFGVMHRGKTHCVKGHPFSGANLFTYQRGNRQVRVCVACDKERGIQWRNRKLAAMKQEQG